MASNRKIARKFSAQQRRNAESDRWTNDEDNFLRNYAGLPLEEMTSALNKTLKTARTQEGVKKRRHRLHRKDIRQAILTDTPRVTIDIAGVSVTGVLTPSIAKKIISNIVFSNELRTGV